MSRFARKLRRRSTLCQRRVQPRRKLIVLASRYGVEVADSVVESLIAAGRALESRPA